MPCLGSPVARIPRVKEVFKGRQIHLRGRCGDFVETSTSGAGIRRQPRQQQDDHNGRFRSRRSGQSQAMRTSGPRKSQIPPGVNTGYKGPPEIDPLEPDEYDYLQSGSGSWNGTGWVVEPPSESEHPLRMQLFKGGNKFILASAFVIGIGAGIAVDTVVNIEPSNVASREVIDRQTPNPDVCLASGMSAMVLDQRLFISFNPFNVYVSQAEVKPGCVLRQSNWQVLESRGLVTSDEVRDCKRNMNTFGFVGDLRSAPEISCVYHSETAENQFLRDPTKATLGDGIQRRDFGE